MKKIILVSNEDSEDNGTTLIMEKLVMSSGPSRHVEMIKFKAPKEKGFRKLLARVFPLNKSLERSNQKALSNLARRSEIDFIFFGHNMFKQALFWSQRRGGIKLALVDNKLVYYQRKIGAANYHILKRIIFKIIYHLWRLNYRIYILRDKNLETIFVSDLDGTQYKKLGANFVRVIKNGVSNIDVAPHRFISFPYFAVFHGDLGYEPNQLAATYFERLCTDLDCGGVIFGKNSGRISANCQRIQYFDYVESLSTYLNSANIYFALIPFGSGIKNKVLEALSAGMLVVGTDVAFDGIETSQLCCFVFNLEEFENEVVRLKKYLEIYIDNCKNPFMKNAEYVRKFHDWSDVSESYFS